LSRRVASQGPAVGDVRSAPRPVDCRHRARAPAAGPRPAGLGRPNRGAGRAREGEDRRPRRCGDRGSAAGAQRGKERTEDSLSLSDLEIARRAKLVRIESLGESLGLLPDELEPYGRHKAKISLQAIERLTDRPAGRYVCVTGINPTPLGEGKTVVTI